jgi:putative DNA methylase
MTYRKKLIEVALPLEAINVASAREKSIRHGHPSTLHLWWARRPLAAARAVIFAQMVDDPSAHPEKYKTEEEQSKERQKLFRIIEEMVKWKDTAIKDKAFLQAHDEILRSWCDTCAEHADHPRAAELFDRYKLPAFHDPFAGGGALPLEAQRLGLESYASDLNPVAVLINKAMIEIPPKFAGKPSVNPAWRNKSEAEKMGREWKGAQGLADDVCYYGQWMRDEAEKRIGHLYPKIEVTEAMAEERPDLKKYVGRKLTVIAWLWARTVKSPNPAFADVDVPLASTFMLSTKAGKEAYVQPVIEDGGYRFTVKVGKPKDAEGAKNGTKLSRGANFRCLMSESPMTGDYIKSEGKAGRMGSKLMAIVAEGDRGRVYLSPTQEMEMIANAAHPEWKPDMPLHGKARDQMPLYGMESFADLFTTRQLVALTTFSDLVQEAREQVKRDAMQAGLPDDGKPLAEQGAGAAAYADAVAVYLALIVDRMTDSNSTIVSWTSQRDTLRNTFARQALPMVWDFAEANPFSDSSGNYIGALSWVEKAMNGFSVRVAGHVAQSDAQSQIISSIKIVSTDPPYYDNIGYADLSDFFYVWLRRSMKPIFPDLFSTLVVPKAEELVATPYRHGSREKAEQFFLEGMTQAMHRLAEQAHPAFPVTIYYAFKQSETGNDDGTTNTGWDTFLAAVIKAGFSISGTWPVRTEREGRSIGNGTNALASSIVLVCRKRPENAPVATFREFDTALKSELPQALAQLQAGNIAPVDLAQAAIGPGMAVYTRYASVLDAEGKPLSVRAALARINKVLDEALAEQEGDFDADSRWALAWFEQMGFNDGEFGIADVLARAKATAVDGIVEAGIAFSGKGKVRLFRPAELAADWDPSTDRRLTVWEMVHQLIRVLETDGETAASAVVAKLGSDAETARELCYRLYTLCERKKRPQEAMAYNALVQSWPELTRLAGEMPGVSAAGNYNLFENE